MDPFDRVVPARESIQEKEEREGSYDICSTRVVVLAGSPGSSKPEPSRYSEAAHPTLL
jgi:hypothetical protein